MQRRNCPVNIYHYYVTHRVFDASKEPFPLKFYLAASKHGLLKGVGSNDGGSGIRDKTKLEFTVCEEYVHAQKNCWWSDITDM